MFTFRIFVPTLALAIFFMAVSSATASEPRSRILFDFGQAEDSAAWRTVNDGVMGGISDGRRRLTNEGWLEFYGNLSLANNGGFASVRSRSQGLGLTKGQDILVRLRGDGRKYTFNLYVPNRRMAFSYRTSFETKQGEWQEIRIPMASLVPTSFGRRDNRASQLDPSRVTGIGFLLGDKKAGPFKLEVDWIKAVASTN